MTDLDTTDIANFTSAFTTAFEIMAKVVFKYEPPR